MAEGDTSEKRCLGVQCEKCSLLSPLIWGWLGCKDQLLDGSERRRKELSVGGKEGGALLPHSCGGSPQPALRTWEEKREALLPPALGLMIERDQWGWRNGWLPRLRWGVVGEPLKGGHNYHKHSSFTKSPQTLVAAQLRAAAVVALTISVL